MSEKEKAGYIFCLFTLSLIYLPTSGSCYDRFIFLILFFNLVFESTTNDNRFNKRCKIKIYMANLSE